MHLIALVNHPGIDHQSCGGDQSAHDFGIVWLRLRGERFCSSRRQPCPPHHSAQKRALHFRSPPARACSCICKWKRESYEYVPGRYQRPQARQPPRDIAPTSWSISILPPRLILRTLRVGNQLIDVAQIVERFDPVGRSLDFLNIELAIEKIVVDPAAAPIKKFSVIIRPRRSVTEGARHFFAGSQGSEIINSTHPDSDHRIRRLEVLCCAPLSTPSRFASPHPFAPRQIQSLFLCGAKVARSHALSPDNFQSR